MGKMTAIVVLNVISLAGKRSRHAENITEIQLLAGLPVTLGIDTLHFRLLFESLLERLLCLHVDVE